MNSVYELMCDVCKESAYIYIFVWFANTKRSPDYTDSRGYLGKWKKDSSK